MSNTTSFIDQKIKEGKCRIGACDISTCDNHGITYRITDGFLCSDCLDKIGEILGGYGHGTQNNTATV